MHIMPADIRTLGRLYNVLRDRIATYQKQIDLWMPVLKSAEEAKLSLKELMQDET